MPFTSFKRFFYLPACFLFLGLSICATCWGQSTTATTVVSAKVEVPPAASEQLALTPPMGWNTWNRFQCNVSEELIKGAADALVATGMQEAGYEYIVIDDCWQIGRDEQGNIQADPERFPNGIKSVADYVHSKGLKFGIYTCAGTMTCAERPGSRGYEFQDMRQYAEWGVDYVKIDWCFTGEGDAAQNARASYGLLREAIDQAGRPMVLSICEWGVSKPWEWANGVGQLWRTTYDIADCWACGTTNHMGWTKILDMQPGLEKYAGPGHWNDPDMLEVGNGGLSLEESRAHFSLWCILAAPLMAGNDLNDMSPETLAILTNRELIAVNQDPLGQQGIKVRDEGDYELWSKELSGGDYAIAMLNRSGEPKGMSFSWSEIGLPDGKKADVRNLWSGEELGVQEHGFTASIPSHGVVVVRISPKE